MKGTVKTDDRGIVDNSSSPHVSLKSVNLSSVKWTRGFWADRHTQCREVTLPYLWKRLNDPDTAHALANFRIAAGLEKGEFQGTAWQDEFVYKWLEAASYIYSYTHDENLARQMDEVIDIIARAQEKDGYIATQIMKFKQRFLEPLNHELYVMGHLITAACIHHRITGKNNFLNVARKTADYLYRTFMPRDPKLAHFGINPSYIMAVVDLYRVTGDKKYLDLANTFIDMRGSAPGGSDFNQTHVPLREEEHVVGHAVFYTYLFAGAADTYMETGDKSLLAALERLWKDLVLKKMYVTGGVCAIHNGLSIRGDVVMEAAGNDYDLPNSTAYNETCSQIGNFMWNWRMLLINSRARHAEIMELNLYNSIISGISLEGDRWLYSNPLRWYGKKHPLLSNDAYERFQPAEPPKREHICCPSNLVRTIAGLHGYMYSTSEEGIWVNLYGANTFNGKLPDGSVLKFSQETDYPWDGKVMITINEAPDREFSFMFRIPSWTQQAGIRINGKEEDIDLQPGTYAAVKRTWTKGDVVELTLPMKVRLIEAHPWVEQDRNQVAVTRGPLVYCLESPDLPESIKLSQVRIPRDIKLKPRHDENLLNGVTILEGEALIYKEEDWENTLYREMSPEPLEPFSITLIPYFAWANRGISEMSVWLPLA